MVRPVKEMPKILVACNTLTSIGIGPYMDHNQLSYHLGKDFGKKFEFFQFNAKRMSIDRFRNMAMKIAISSNLDYIFFIDDDMQLHADAFKKLYEADYDIIAALNYVRGYPFEVMAFRYDDQENKKHLRFVKDEEVEAANGGVIPVEAIGTAVCLLKMKRLKKVPAPWFVTGPRNTEDVYFCMRCQDYFEKKKPLRIGLHTGVITGHVLDPEVVNVYTKSHLKKYYESFMTPEEIEFSKNKDRGEAYVKQNIESEINS